MSTKSSVSALEVRKAVERGLFTERQPVRMVRAGEKNFATTPDFQHSPLDLLIAIETRNRALMEQLDLAALSVAMDVSSVLATVQDTERAEELHRRKLALEESAKWKRIEANNAKQADIPELMEEWRADLAEWSVVDSLPPEEIRRVVKVKHTASALSMGLVNTVVPAATVYVTCEPEKTTPQTIEETKPQDAKFRKQTARKAYLRKLRFIAQRERHHIQSVKRIDGMLMVRYWFPIVELARTGRKAGRYRRPVERCTHYALHCVTLHQYLALYDDSGVGTPTERQQWTRQQVRNATPAVREEFQLKSLCDIDRTPQRLAERFAGESSGETIHRTDNPQTGTYRW